MLLSIAVVEVAACAVGNPAPGGPPPLPGVALNAAYVANSGLLTGMQADGTPTLTGAAADPAIAETRLGFWDTENNPGVEIGGSHFPSAADAFLARRGGSRRVQRLESGLGVQSREQPDSLCGGDVNGGATCDTVTDRCQPVTMAAQ